MPLFTAWHWSNCCSVLLKPWDMYSLTAVLLHQFALEELCTHHSGEKPPRLGEWEQRPAAASCRAECMAALVASAQPGPAGHAPHNTPALRGTNEQTSSSTRAPRVLIPQQRVFLGLANPARWWQWCWCWDEVLLRPDLGGSVATGVSPGVLALWPPLTAAGVQTKPVTSRRVLIAQEYRSSQLLLGRRGIQAWVARVGENGMCFIPGGFWGLFWRSTMENAWIVAAFATLGCVDDRVCLLACQAFLPSLAQTYFEDFFFFSSLLLAAFCP